MDQPDTPELDVDAKRAALAAVLATKTFRRTAQLSSFLRFVCEREIEGRAQEISEYVIGIEVLGRPPGYSTAEDSLVRRRAVDLRQKLEGVYATELPGETLRIDLPRGRYVPRFVHVIPSPAPDAADDAETPSTEGAPMPPALLRGRLAAYLAGVATGCALTAGGFLYRASRPAVLASSVLYEAEGVETTLGRGATPWPCRQCSGGARVRRLGGHPHNHVVFHGIKAPAAGVYEVELRYLLKGSRSLFLSANGGTPTELALTADDWGIVSSATVPLRLKHGDNSVWIGNDVAPAPDLDAILVAKSPSGAK